MANRVAEIQDLVPAPQWRHVPTDSNPADHASRGFDNQRVSLRGPMVEWAYLAQTASEPLAIAYGSLSCSSGVQTSRLGRHSGRYNHAVEDILQLRQARLSCLLVQEIPLPMLPTSERAKRRSTLSHFGRSSLYQDSHSKTLTAAVLPRCLPGIVETEDPSYSIIARTWTRRDLSESEFVWGEQMYHT